MWQAVGTTAPGKPARSCEYLLHGHERNREPARKRVVDSLIPGVSVGLVEALSRQCSHQLGRPKAALACLCLAELSSVWPIPRRAQSGRTKNARIRAESIVGSSNSDCRPPCASAPKSFLLRLQPPHATISRFRLGNEIGAVADELRVDAPRGAQCGLDLLARVVVPTQPACRIGNQPHKDGHIFRTRFSHRDRGAALREQVDIGAFNQLRWQDAQPCSMRSWASSTPTPADSPSASTDFKLQKMSEAFDLVEVDACSADQKQRPVLSDPSHLPVRRSQQLAQRVRR